MKVILRFFAIIALFVAAPNLRAQPYWDISTGVGFGNNIAGRISLDFVLENQLSLSGFYQGHIEKLGLLLFVEESRVSGLAGGMVGYAPTLGDMWRLNLRGGIGYYHGGTIPSIGGADGTVFSNIGWIVAPRFELLLSRVFGLGFGGYAVFAREKSLYGISLDLMLGELQD